MASALLLALLWPVMAMVALAVRIDSRGPALHWSQRFGANARLFAMPKFRSMTVDTPQVATHLLGDGKSHLTRIGGFIRRTSLDELPQLWSVLIGDMSLVGPRPALFNQHDLMALRETAGVAAMRPGITGWAQINGRDDLPLGQKVTFERDYLERWSNGFDIKILWLTLARVVRRDGVAH